MKSAAVLVVLAMVTPAEVGLAGMLGVRTGVMAGCPAGGVGCNFIP